jgi:ankyrin repeat protein
LFHLFASQFISYLNLAPYSSAQRGLFNNDGLLSIIQRNPHLARTRHDFTFASGAVPPVFMAVSLGADKKLVAALSEACPAALGQTDRYGRTPLHQAVEFGSSTDVVQYLLEQRPQSAADADHIGRTPLHCACAYSASIDIVRILCKFCPKSVFQKDHRGRLPVHISCAHEDDGDGSSIQVVRYLLELNPHSVHERTAKGSTALELVEKGRASLEVMLSVSAVATMLKENPSRATAMSLISRLERMEWRSGILLYLDINPSIMHTLDLRRDEKLLPYVLSSVGKHCKLGTMFEVVKDMAECLTGAE